LLPGPTMILISINNSWFLSLFKGIASYALDCYGCTAKVSVPSKSTSFCNIMLLMIQPGLASVNVRRDVPDSGSGSKEIPISDLVGVD